MKKLLPVFLALLLLTACAPHSETVMESQEVPEPAFSLPETSDAEPVSAEAIVTEGRAPAEDYDLPVPQEFSPEQSYMRYNMDDWIRSGTVGILAESPDGNAAFYGLPFPADGQGGHETALIRWGDSLAEFDWYFVTPRMYLPQMAVMDLDGDGEDELVIMTYYGSGTGASAYELHVLEKNPDGTLTDYAMPEKLWQEQIPPLLQYVSTDGRNFLILGRELVEISPEQIPPVIPEEHLNVSTGFIANFRLLPEENAVQFLGAVDLGGIAHYVAEYTANVGYQDGVFTLSDFHLNAY